MQVGDWCPNMLQVSYQSVLTVQITEVPILCWVLQTFCSWTPPPYVHILSTDVIYVKNVPRHYMALPPWCVYYCEWKLKPKMRQILEQKKPFFISAVLLNGWIDEAWLLELICSVLLHIGLSLAKMQVISVPFFCRKYLELSPKVWLCAWE